MFFFTFHFISEWKWLFCFGSCFCLLLHYSKNLSPTPVLPCCLPLVPYITPSPYVSHAPLDKSICLCLRISPCLPWNSASAYFNMQNASSFKYMQFRGTVSLLEYEIGLKLISRNWQCLWNRGHTSDRRTTPTSSQSPTESPQSTFTFHPGFSAGGRGRSRGYKRPLNANPNPPPTLP